MIAARSPNRSDLFAELRAPPAPMVRVVQALEMPIGPKRDTGPCPACGATTRHQRQGDKRAAVGIRTDLLGAICFECSQTFDPVSFLTWRLYGDELSKGDPRWADFRLQCAGLGLCDPPAGSSIKRPKLPALPVFTPSQSWLPGPHDVAALLEASGSVDTDPQVAGYLRGRRPPIDPAIVARLDVARALPACYVWPSWWPQTRCRTWRLVVPAYDASGRVVAIHARAIRSTAEKYPKTLWPKAPDDEHHFAASGLLMADRRGRDFLRRELEPPKVLVVEGLTDLLAAAVWCERAQRPYAVLSVTSGASRALAEVKWPANSACVVATDPDPAGEKYAREIREALPPHIHVARVKFPARHETP